MSIIIPPITGDIQVDSWSQQITEEVRRLMTYHTDDDNVRKIVEELIASATQGDAGEDGVSIIGASIDGSFHLILTLSNTNTIDAGDLSAAISASVSTWINYAEEWASAPTLHSSPAGGDLYQYTYNNGSLYRFVPDPYDATQDKFYSDSAMTTLVATRASNI